MSATVLMPALSPTMEKGKLSKWLKKEGDKVKSGDVLAEIETDKATMEVESIDEGTLGKILVAEGTDDVAVNTPIAVILAEGEKVGYHFRRSRAKACCCDSGSCSDLQLRLRQCAATGCSCPKPRMVANGARGAACSLRHWLAVSPSRRVSIWQRWRVRARMAAS